MLPEQKDLVFKHFQELVQKCDLKLILDTLISKGQLTTDFLGEISLEDDKYHNNRCILFKLLQYQKINIFPGLIEGLQETGSHALAAILDNKYHTIENSNDDALNVTLDVKLSTQFYDTEQYNSTSFYSTRSKERGCVLIINNIKFSQESDERHGAEADELQLRSMFETMGLTVFVARNLSAHDMYLKSQEFSQTIQHINPDIAMVIVMSHGLIMKNETMIVSSDNKLVPEDNFRIIFNNDNCALFRKKPKIFIYHICRTVLKDPVIKETMTDANVVVKQRTYSDMLICHPSLKGYSAYRNSVKGSWYIQLLCKVFMNHAHNMDVESLLKKLDEELEVVSSLPWQVEDGNHNTEQTSTFQNIAFKRCYIHPGIYEENKQIKKFSH